MAKGYRQGVPHEFVMRDAEYYRKAATGKCQYAPSVRRLTWWMDTEDNRDLLAEVISAGRRAFRMKPVTSNRELLERIDEYFSVVQGRRVPPTVEEFSLYMGFSVATLYKLISGQNSGYPDQIYGLSTGEIFKKALDMLHQADAIQASKRIADPATYIFRSKNYYGMRDNADAPITINVTVPEALPPEQIAKMLPDLTPDRSMEGVVVDNVYEEI